MTENDQKEIKKTRQENLDRLKKKLNEAQLFTRKKLTGRELPSLIVPRKSIMRNCSKQYIELQSPALPHTKEGETRL